MFKNKETIREEQKQRKWEKENANLLRQLVIQELIREYEKKNPKVESRLRKVLYKITVFWFKVKVFFTVRINFKEVREKQNRSRKTLIAHFGTDIQDDVVNVHVLVPPPEGYAEKYAQKYRMEDIIRPHYNSFELVQRIVYMSEQMRSPALQGTYYQNLLVVNACLVDCIPLEIFERYLKVFRSKFN